MHPPRSALVALALLLACNRDGEAEPAATPAPAPTNPVDAALAVPRPTDAAPARLGRPEDSAAEAPIWARGGYAPLLVDDDADAMWKATSDEPSADPIDRELLACELDRGPGDERHDWYSHVRVALADDLEISGSLRGRTRRLHFGIPLVSLAPGQTLTIEIGDAAHELPFRGRPLRASDSGVALECRVVPAAARDEAVLDVLWKTDRKLASLSATSVDDLGEAEEVERAVRKAEETLTAAAALVGWDDPRVRKRRERAREVEARGVGKVVVELADVRAEDVGGWVRIGPKFSARVDDMKCELPVDEGEGVPDPAYACEITLTVQNGDRDPFELGGARGTSLYFGPLRMSALDATGRDSELEVSVDAGKVAADSAGQIRITATPAWVRDETSRPPTIPVRLQWNGKRRSGRLFRRMSGNADKPKISSLPRPPACTGASPPQACGPVVPAGR